MNTKCGFVAILGQTNVGKSTLINTLTNSFVSIVSHKVQTTRRRTIGILTINNTQIVFVDTPGIFKARDLMDKAMIKNALSSLEQDDVILVLISAKQGITDHTKTIISAIKERNKKAIAIINKIDLVKKEELLILAKELDDTNAFNKFFMINALKNKGTKELISHLENILPESPFLYETNSTTIASKSEFLSEITREFVYEYVHQELPYTSYVATKSIEENDKFITVYQEIYVEKDNQKGIVIGANGTKLKTIGMASRMKMEKELGKKVNLYLTIKVGTFRKDIEKLKVMGIVED